MTRLECWKALLKARSAKLIHYSLRSISELEEEDYYNRKARLTIKPAKAATIGNDIFNPEFLEQ